MRDPAPLSPLTVKRLKIRGKASGRELAAIDWAQTSLADAIVGEVLAHHELGALLNRAAEYPEEFGDAGADHAATMAAYFGLDAKQRLEIQRFARRFSVKAVGDVTRRLVLSGRYIGLEHWLALAIPEAAEDRIWLLNRIGVENLSGAASRKLAENLQWLS